MAYRFAVNDRCTDAQVMAPDIVWTNLAGMRASGDPGVSGKAQTVGSGRGKPQRVERGSISAGQITAGALDLAGTIGLDALSMPKLAQHLGIGVTSIYWYFRNKNDLIEALTIVAARRFHEALQPRPGSTWDEQLLENFMRLRAAMRADAVYCDLIFMRGGRASESALALMWPDTEVTIAKMVDAGFTPEEALQNIVILSLYTRGSVVLERQMLRDGLALDAPTPVFDRFPLLTKALETQNTRGVSEQAYGEQLRLIIDGMALRLVHHRKG